LDFLFRRLNVSFFWIFFWSGIPLGVLTAVELYVLRGNLKDSVELHWELVKLSAFAIDLLLIPFFGVAINLLLVFPSFSLLLQDFVGNSQTKN